ncbi:hypothetical protein RHODGE_RHODGE_00648 [Rhodoplanes serenus]|uniref:ABC transporter substrate-binding protein n=1 Tax=Rhodoplanes serenus TaxID=200615 RepID=A0A447CQN8_9BRAD|nr:tripartite tricarboxylate transporter substrate binding protein [Rhodoplanes serenus]MBI5111902.1 tripartite tricarboxylate transporter substrate binding protein [Rhodovulum sp.]VCU07560.1 hypothetical protein RHODGE_RHODGE_00648 [Rhodoplanes serenus]
MTTSTHPPPGPSRRAVLVAAAGAAALGGLGLRVARAFPTEPVTVIIPYAPGTTDQLVRVLGMGMEKTLGKPLVTETKPGGGGSVGASYVAKRAKPDGHTLIFGVSAFHTIAPHQTALPYGFADLKPVARLTVGPNMMAARVGAPFKDVRELVAYAKANPEKVTYGSAGTGGALHLAGEAFAQAAGIKLTHVPFQGVTPAVAAAVGGTVDLAFGFAQAVMPQVDGGRLVALAQFGPKRTKVLPDVPTFRDMGVDLAMPPLTGFWAPAATPDDVVAKLAEAIRVGSMAPDFVAFCEKSRTEIDYVGPAEFRRELETENAFFLDMLKRLGMARTG